MLDEKRIQEIKERAEKATPGPWEWNKAEGWGPDGYSGLNSPTECVAMGCGEHSDGCIVIENKDDAEFISHAKDDIDALLKTISDLRSAEQGGWIAVSSGEIPRKNPDPFEELSSEEILLNVPFFAARDRSPVVIGYYLFGSKQFVPTGSHGFSDEVTHWRYKPAPPAAPKKSEDMTRINKC